MGKQINGAFFLVSATKNMTFLITFIDMLIYIYVQVPNDFIQSTSRFYLEVTSLY